MGMFLVSFVILVALITVLSGIGVAEHCGVGSGGVYSMVSSVLGGQTGGTIGLLYVFGQVSLGCWVEDCVLRPLACVGPLPHLLFATIFLSMFAFCLGRHKGRPAAPLF